MLPAKNKSCIARTLQITHHALPSFPVDMAIAVKKLTKLLDCICDIRPGAYGEIHDGTDKRAVRSLSHNIAFFIGRRCMVFAGEMQSWFHGRGDGYGIGQAKLFNDLVDESSL